MAEDKLSTAESLKSTRTYGQVRCMNPSCDIQNHPGTGTDEGKMPDMRFRVAYLLDKARFSRVKGPVWETSEKLAHEQWTKLTEKKEGK